MRYTLKATKRGDIEVHDWEVHRTVWATKVHWDGPSVMEQSLTGLITWTDGPLRLETEGGD